MGTSLEPVTRVSSELKALLNSAIAREIQVAVQYMWQHVQVMGVKAVAVQDLFKQIAIQEMRHAEKIAERLWYLGEYPHHQACAHSGGQQPQRVSRTRHQGRGRGC